MPVMENKFLSLRKAVKYYIYHAKLLMGPCVYGK